MHWNRCWVKSLGPWPSSCTPLVWAYFCAVKMLAGHCSSHLLLYSQLWGGGLTQNTPPAIFLSLHSGSPTLLQWPIWVWKWWRCIAQHLQVWQHVLLDGYKDRMRVESRWWSAIANHGSPCLLNLTKCVPWCAITKNCGKWGHSSSTGQKCCLTDHVHQIVAVCFPNAHTTFGTILREHCFNVVCSLCLLVLVLGAHAEAGCSTYAEGLVFRLKGSLCEVGKKQSKLNGVAQRIGSQIGVMNMLDPMQNVRLVVWDSVKHCKEHWKQFVRANGRRVKKPENKCCSEYWSTGHERQIRNHGRNVLRWNVCRVNFARKIFFEPRIFLRKMLPKFSPKFVLWVRKIPKFSKFPCEKSKKNSPTSFCRSAGRRMWNMIVNLERPVVCKIQIICQHPPRALVCGFQNCQPHQVCKHGQNQILCALRSLVYACMLGVPPWNLKYHWGQNDYLPNFYSTNYFR